MKLTIEHSPLNQALKNIRGVFERKASIPILSHALMEADQNSCRLTATNLDIQSVYEIPAIVTEPGKSVLPAQTLSDIVQNLQSGAQIDISISDEGRASLLAGRSDFALNTISADEFPYLEEETFPHAFTIPGEDLKRLLEKTLFAASSDEGRYYLNGIYFHAPKGGRTLRSVATDGYRLASADCALPDKAQTIPGVIVPRKTLSEILRLLESAEEEVEIGLSKNMIRFQCGPATITSKLVDGTFPDYARVIPDKHSKALTIGRAELSEAVRRVSAVHADGIAPVKLDLEKRKLTLTSSNHEVASSKEDMEVEYEAESLQISFQARYLLDIAQHMGERIRLEMDTPGAPTVFRDCDDSSILYVLMPMRV